MEILDTYCIAKNVIGFFYLNLGGLVILCIAGYLHFDFHTYKSTDILPFQNSKESVSINNIIKKICSVNTLGTEVFGSRRLTKVVEGLLSSLYYKYGTIRCLGLHFSDRTVRLTEIF